MAKQEVTISFPADLCWKESNGPRLVQTPGLEPSAGGSRQWTVNGSLLQVTDTGHCPHLQYYTCSCILGFIACSVFLRMSLELKAMLLTVALVAYLLLFNLSPCWHVSGNSTETNGTQRWGLICWCLSTAHYCKLVCFDIAPDQSRMHLCPWPSGPDAGQMV